MLQSLQKVLHCKDFGQGANGRQRGFYISHLSWLNFCYGYCQNVGIFVSIANNLVDVSVAAASPFDSWCFTYPRFGVGGSKISADQTCWDPDITWIVFPSVNGERCPGCRRMNTCAVASAGVLLERLRGRVQILISWVGRASHRGNWSFIHWAYKRCRFRPLLVCGLNFGRAEIF